MRISLDSFFIYVTSKKLLAASFQHLAIDHDDLFASGWKLVASSSSHAPFPTNIAFNRELQRSSCMPRALRERCPYATMPSTVANSGSAKADGILAMGTGHAIRIGLRMTESATSMIPGKREPPPLSTRPAAQTSSIPA